MAQNAFGTALANTVSLLMFTNGRIQGAGPGPPIFGSQFYFLKLYTMSEKNIFEIEF